MGDLCYLLAGVSSNLHHREERIILCSTHQDIQSLDKLEFIIHMFRDIGANTNASMKYGH